MVEAHDEQKPGRRRAWIFLPILVAVIALAIAAAVLPYIAVVFANAGDDSVPTEVESPLIELERPAERSDAPSPDRQVITLAETPARSAEPNA